MMIYVVTWRHFDGSGSGPVSAHWTKEAAETMRIILSLHADKQFDVTPVPCEPLP